MVMTAYSFTAVFLHEILEVFDGLFLSSDILRAVSVPSFHIQEQVSDSIFLILQVFHIEDLLPSNVPSINVCLVLNALQFLSIETCCKMIDCIFIIFTKLVAESIIQVVDKAADDCLIVGQLPVLFKNHINRVPVLLLFVTNNDPS